MELEKIISKASDAGSGNRTRKNLWNSLRVLLVSVPLIAMLFAGYFFQKEDITKLLTLQISLGQTRQEISLWDAGDGELYCFLPAYIPLTDISFRVAGTQSVFLEEMPVGSGMSLEGLSPEKTYALRFKSVFREKAYSLTFFQAENVASLYLDVPSGSMKHIHGNKKNAEKANVLLVDDTGVVYQSTGFRDRLSGHGNTTWVRDKKPYNLDLGEPADLMGAGAASRWILLANYLDQAHMRNEIVYRLARQTGEVWNPHTKYVDLYLNGTYAGLYQLSDRVEVSENRLNLKPGDVFLNFEISDRAQDFSVSEVFPGISVEIRYPAALSEREFGAVEASLRRILSGIENHTFTEQTLREVLDVDSWAWQYLIQEISLNYDSGVASQYCYLHEGRLYSGPVWDFDNSFGSWAKYTPQNLFSQETVRSPLWRSLLSYDCFRQRVQELYVQRFLPHLEKLLEEEYFEIAEGIKKSSRMNWIRWNPDARSTGNMDAVDSGVMSLYAFLRERVEFLNRLWVAEEAFQNVKICSSGAAYGVYGYYAVERGTVLGEFLKEKFDGISYTVSDLDESRLAEPVEEDLTLSVVISNAAGEEDRDLAELNWKGRMVYWLKYHKEEALSYGSAVFLCSLLVLFFFLEIRRGKETGKRESADS